MLIQLTAPALVSDFGVGEMFFGTLPSRQLHMVCAGDGGTGEPRYVVALPADATNDATVSAPDVRIFDLDDFSGQAALPIQRGDVLYPHFAVQGNSGGGVPKPDGLVYADQDGYWMPINGMWLNLGSGLLSTKRPSAPWVELGAFEMRTPDGETLIHWSVY